MHPSYTLPAALKILQALENDVVKDPGIYIFHSSPIKMSLKDWAIK